MAEYLTARDLTAIGAEVDRIRAALPLVGWNMRARYQKASATGEVQGTLPGYHQAMDWELARGAVFVALGRENLAARVRDWR